MRVRNGSAVDLQALVCWEEKARCEAPTAARSSIIRTSRVSWWNCCKINAPLIDDEVRVASVNKGHVNVICHHAGNKQQYSTLSEDGVIFS